MPAAPYDPHSRLRKQSATKIQAGRGEPEPPNRLYLKTAESTPIALDPVSREHKFKSEAIIRGPRFGCGVGKTCPCRYDASARINALRKATHGRTQVVAGDFPKIAETVVTLGLTAAE